MVIFFFLVIDSFVEECKVICIVYFDGNVKVTDGKVIGFDMIFECFFVINY